MKKYVVIALLVPLFFFGGAKPAVAFFVDIPQLIKEYGLDLAGWLLSSWILGDMTTGTADWVNRGFEQTVRQVVIDAAGNPTVQLGTAAGDPSFVINPGDFFRNLSTDSIAGFFEEFQRAGGRNMEEIFGDFGDELLRDIAGEARLVTDDFFEQFRATFQTREDRIVREQFLEDFTQGGWATFLETVQCPNDYSCARLVVLGEARARAEQVVAEKRAELEQGGGFLTMRRCAQHGADGACEVYEAVTPGNLISEQIAAATRIEFERVAGADELAESLMVILERVASALIQRGLSEIDGHMRANRDLARQQGRTGEQVIRGAQRMAEMTTRQVDGCIIPGPDPDGTLCVNPERVVLTRENSVAEVTVTRTDFASYSGPITVEGFGGYREHVEVIPSDNIELTDERATIGNPPRQGQSMVLTIRVRENAVGRIGNFNNLSGHILIGGEDRLRLRIDVRGEEPREEERAEETTTAPPTEQP